MTGPQIRVSGVRNRRAEGWSDLGSPQHHQLDGPSDVPLLGHGPPQRLHGGVIGAPQQRLSVNGHELVVDPQTPVLWKTIPCYGIKTQGFGRLAKADPDSSFPASHTGQSSKYSLLIYLF